MKWANKNKNIKMEKCCHQVEKVYFQHSTIPHLSFIFLAPFRIKNVGNNMCMKSPGSDSKGAGVSTSACSNADTQWVYTLTGALMVNTRLFSTISKGIKT